MQVLTSLNHITESSRNYNPKTFHQNHASLSVFHRKLRPQFSPDLGIRKFTNSVPSH